MTQHSEQQNKEVWQLASLRFTMTTSLQVVWTIFIGFSIGVFRHQFAAAEGTNSSEQGKLSTKPLIFTWIAKPPYIEPPTNGSSGSEERGMFNDAVTRYIIVECGLLHPVPIKYELSVIGARSEFEMIELLRQNKAQVALPIFEHIINRQYGEFPFFKVVDYPGTEYITIDDNSSALTVVLDAVFKAWPLLAVTIVLTAIAGIIMWALDTYWNSEEFPRSFIKGSWDGFWWSFISMTTVGYGDKSPKSIVARIFSIIWIMLGLITMAIFTANITSALTAASLELTPNSLDGLKVGVLQNGTEYEHALLEGASPTEYATIEEMIQELHSKQIDGVLLDHYAASYYQARDKLKSLIMVTKFEFSRDVGLLFSKDRQELAGCLNFHRSNIWRLAQTITSTYKLNKQKTSKKFNLFGDSNHFVKQLLYISLGVLGGLLLIGIVWDTFCRKKDQKIKEELELGVVNGGLSTERQTIHSDTKVARTLLKQMETHLHRLEAKVSRIDFKR